MTKKNKEIIKLQKRIIFWREDLNYQPEKIKAEAIKEFAIKLKCGVQYEAGVIRCKDVDELVKEMTEGQG